MALIKAYGLDDCISTADTQKLGITSATFQPSGGKFGGGSITFPPANTTGGGIPVGLPVAGNRAFAFYACLTVANGVVHMKNAQDGSLIIGEVLRITSIEVILLNGASKATVVSKNETSIFADLQYHWVEFTVQGSDVVLYVDDLELLRVPAGSISMVTETLYANCAPSASCRIDDVISWDSSGIDFNTFPIHPQRISLINPRGAGDASEFVPVGVGENWSAVNKTSYSGSLSQYVVADTSGKRDLYVYQPMVYVPWKVNAVVSKVFAQESGSVSGNLEILAKSAGTEGVIGTISLPVGANYVIPSVSYKDPSGAVWTASTLNAAQFGYRS